MELQRRLKLEAISLGLCQQWQDEWGEPNTLQLIDKYKRGIDFCIEHDFPSVDVLRKEFDRAVLNENDIFVNDNIALNIDKGGRNIIINGDCEGVITISGYAVATIYVRHTSCVRVVMKDFARASISVYDKSQLTVNNRSYNRAFVYRYSSKAYVNEIGNIAVREIFNN